MIRIHQDHKLYGMIPAYPQFYDYNSANFTLLPYAVENTLRKRCCIHAVVTPKDEEYVITFTDSGHPRKSLKGEMTVENLDEQIFGEMADLVAEQLLPQIGKDLDDDIVVLVDVS